jgi:predicted lipoprotein with Yx(FWY)xxD motif
MSRIESAVLRSVRWFAPFVALVALGAVGAGAVSAATKPTVVTTHQTKRGKVLAAADGRTLYMFTSDKAGKSECTGACASTWLPLLTPRRPVAAAGSGVNAKLLGTIKRPGNTLQVTYNGHPLYRFTRDKSAGQIAGEGAEQFGGHWYVVNTSGNPLKPKAANSGGLCNPVCQAY